MRRYCWLRKGRLQRKVCEVLRRGVPYLHSFVLTRAEVAAYMAKSGLLDQGAQAFLEKLQHQQQNLVMNEQAQMETVQKLYNTIATRTAANKEEAFAVRTQANAKINTSSLDIPLFPLLLPFLL